MTNRRPNLYRGLLFGAIAGATAAWTMNQFQALLSKAAERQQSRSQHNPQTNSQNNPQTASREGEAETPEDATTKAADRLAHAVHVRPLTRQEKAKAGPIVHYAFGAAMGALYGVAAEYFPRARAGFGTIFGTLLFAMADEAAVPLAGLSGKPSEYPVSSHLRAFASHIVYGASAEAVRAVLTRAA